MMRIAVIMMGLGAASMPVPASAQDDRPVTRQLAAPGNPLIGDGSVYSNDPAPLVADGKFYIIAGKDEAAPDDPSFVIREWQLFATSDPASGRWTDLLHALRPERIFKWAEPGGAYAPQIVRGPDRRFYLYAPVLEAAVKDGDKFGIGVAVADRPEGPYVDAHPSGPIASQRTANARITNIDPTVLVDDDGRVYLYWGTFGELRAVELDRDMVTMKGTPRKVDLRGFFEAPWLMKRNGTYYLLYADNEYHRGERPAECTEAYYYACTGYASAPTPMGPWTYRGVVLRPVSSTTSHTGAVPFRGQWWLAYHTADAKDGGHFRRSVAVDRLEWDDSVSPAAIRLVTPTRRPSGPPAAQRNVAAAATVSASNEPIPGQYLLTAVKDGKAHQGVLPPEMWGSWTGKDDRPAEWLRYAWATPQSLSGTRVWFWNYQPAGAGSGVAPPESWRINYWTGVAWRPVTALDRYATDTGRFVSVRFAPVTTRCLRLAMTASTKDGRYATLGVEEWEALAPVATVVAPVPPAVIGDTRSDGCPGR